MAGVGDRKDRREATRLFIAAGVAVVLLIAMGAAAIYFLTGLGHADAFAQGLGFKEAALISFGVSFVLIMIMAVASGGDAIFGELPFTIVGFLIFFVVFWLMIAWIF
jgi:hypothetical protein